MSSENRQAAMKVIEVLHDSGFQGLWAGGCVRDMLMGIEPQDFDIATDAHPEQVARLFRRTLLVGAQFGVVVVLIGNVQIEVATFRSEDCYTDGRRPDIVQFTDAREDALRRDFTINGMFYDPISEEVLDYVGGKDDLAKGLIRAIGDPDLRFSEDYLRMLRAIRFAARFGFIIDAGTWYAIVENRAKLYRISTERISMELEKILVNVNRYKGMRLLADSGLLQSIFTWCSPAVQEEGLELLKHIEGEVDFGLALAVMMIGDDPEDTSESCRMLKVSNDVRKKASWLLSSLGKFNESLPLSRGRLKQWLACEWFGDLLRLCYARNIQLGLANDNLEQLTEQIAELGDQDISPEPLLNGNDLIAMGIKPGPELGAIFDWVYLAQLEGEIVSKEQAEEMVRGTRQ